MPTPTDNARRKYLSELIKGYGALEEEQGVDYYFARVTVHNASTINDVSTIGTFVVWSDTNERYEIAGNTSTIGSDDGTLPGGAKVAVIVGPRQGKGQPADVTSEPAAGLLTVGATGKEVTVIFRGPATVLREGFEYAGRGIVNTATQAALENQLMKQQFSIMESATVVDPSFIA